MDLFSYFACTDALRKKYWTNPGNLWPPKQLYMHTLHRRYIAAMFRAVHSSSFFFLSSGNTSTTHISGTLRPILTKLGQRDQGPLPFMWPDPSGVKGHVGVTGSKTWFSRKKFQLLGVSRYGRQIYGYETSWDPLQLLLNENFVGSHLWSWRRCQRSIFQLCPISTVDASNWTSRPHD